MSSFFGLSKTRTFKPKRNIPEGTKQYQLKRYAEAIQNDGIYFYLQQLFADATYLQDLPEGLRLDFSKGGVCQLNKIQVIPEYYATFTIGD